MCVYMKLLYAAYIHVNVRKLFAIRYYNFMPDTLT